MRIAFFGGSFDPPHLGHLRIAQAAADRLELDQVRMAPVGVQPLKREARPAPASFADRVAMLTRMVEEAGDRRLVVSEIDRPRADGRPNYTVETLETLRKSLGSDDALFLLAGADSLATLPQWHRAGDLLAGTDMIIAARPGLSIEGLLPALESLCSASRIERPAQTRPGVEHRTLTREGHGTATQLFFLDDLDEKVSATSIRGHMRGQTAGARQHEQDMGAALSPAVLAYIREHALYR